MSDKMVRLATFGNPVGAELARATLEAAGVRAVILGDTSGGIFAGMGAGVSHVDLLVAEGDVERAGAVLDEFEDEEADPDEGSTAIKAEPERKESSTHVRAQAESPVQERPTAAETPADTPTPEAEEQSLPEEEDEREERPVTWMANDTAARALRSAIFGFCVPLGIFPFYLFFILLGLFHLYALWLVIRLGFTHGELSRVGSLKAWLAFAISLFPVFILVLVVAAFLVRAASALLE